VSSLRIYVQGDPNAPFHDFALGAYYQVPVSDDIFDTTEVLKGITGRVREYEVRDAGKTHYGYQNMPKILMVKGRAWGVRFARNILVRGKDLPEVLRIWQELLKP
jgi:hypothetical protein